MACKGLLSSQRVAFVYWLFQEKSDESDFFTGCLLAFSIPGLSADYLSASEVQSIFAGAVAIEPKGQQGVGAKFAEWNFEEDGKLIKYPAGGKKGKSGVQEGTWNVDGQGRLCFAVGSEKKKCRYVSKDGKEVRLFNKKGNEKRTFSAVRGG